MVLSRGGLLTKVRVRIGITVFRFLVAACLVVPLLGHSAGLGRLTLQSGLGEPLRAEVEITSLQPSEVDSLTARLGSPEAFRAAGIEYSPTLVSLRVVLDRRDGRPFLRLSSVRPIDDPFLDIIIELQWSTGRLVREYTFLLDPPQYREKPAAAAPAPSTAQVARPIPTPAPAAPEVRPLPVRPSVSAAGTYEVKRGDTLGKIARENKPEGVTMQQMLVALYRANQGAFIRDNMNLVRAGRILQIPDRETAAGVASTEANSVVRRHTADFSDYRAKLGAAVAARPAVSTPGREATGRIAAKPEAPAPSAQRDQLKLSRADTGKQPSAPAARAAREDDKVASGRALQEAQSRVTDLEKNVGDLQKLLEMKNKQLAQLEQQAKPAAAAAPTPVAEAPKPVAEAPKPVAEAPKPAAEAPKPAAEAPKPAAEAPKPAAEAPKPAAEAPKPAAAEAAKAAPAATKPGVAKTVTTAKPKPVVEASLVDEFLENPIALGGLAAVILLLIAYGAYAWRKKKASQSRFQDSVLGATAPTLAPAPSPSAHTVETAAAVSAAVAATHAASAAADSDDVDPIAEADVYLAYGRDAQAEEILNEALSKHPERVPVHAKLLEIFAHRHDAKGFEKTAKTIRDLTQGNGPEWEKACALGRTVDPENPLYGGAGQVVAGAAAAAAVGPAPAVDFDLGGGPAGEAQPHVAPALDFDIGAATTPGGQTQPFSPGDTVILQPEAAQPAAGAQAKSETLDFDIGSLEPPAPTKPEPAPAPPPKDAGTLDFDLDLDLGTQKPAAPEAPPPVDITTINLDLGKPDPAAAAVSADPRWQEVATKLDLAKAYQGMGDKDGARELLNEVVAQGDTAQQNEAKQMLAALG